MKLFSKLAIAGAVFALAFISTANAQSIRVSVPFSFQAGGQSMPAGEYRVDLNQTGTVITLGPKSGQPSCFLIVKAHTGMGMPDRASLVFNKYGESYFLSDVNILGAPSGVEVFGSHAERELARVHGTPKPVTVLAARR